MLIRSKGLLLFLKTQWIFAIYRIVSDVGIDIQLICMAKST